MTETKMGVREFGDALIRTKDLDPAYVGLHGLVVGKKIDNAQLYRWLIAYWCFYHVGLASWLSSFDGQSFWNRMLTAAINEVSPRDLAGLPADRWPRAAERRHFRGQKCVDAVKWLEEKSRGFNPDWLVRTVIQDSYTATGPREPRTEKSVMKEVQKWPMFGPWIAFKAADMLERCAGVPVYFETNTILMYSEPREALEMLARGEDPEFGHIQDMSVQAWYSNLSAYFKARKAPPALDRFCGPQEVETVLCKWKSYMGGHYHIGKDIRDHRGALAGWGSTAAEMLAYMPEEV